MSNGVADLEAAKSCVISTEQNISRLQSEKEETISKIKILKDVLKKANSNITKGEGIIRSLQQKAEQEERAIEQIQQAMNYASNRGDDTDQLESDLENHQNAYDRLQQEINEKNRTVDEFKKRRDEYKKALAGENKKKDRIIDECRQTSNDCLPHINNATQRNERSTQASSVFAGIGAKRLGASGNQAASTTSKNADEAAQVVRELNNLRTRLSAIIRDLHNLGNDDDDDEMGER